MRKAKVNRSYVLRSMNLATVEQVLASARTLAEAAETLGTTYTTLYRWIKAGKVKKPARLGAVPGPSAPASAPEIQLPDAPLSEWADAVRTARAPFTATDEALIVLASEALIVARDMTIHAAVRLNAAGRFQALVKQLGLVTGPAVVPAEKPKAPETEARRRVDPRDVLRAIK